MTRHSPIHRRAFSLLSALALSFCSACAMEVGEGEVPIKSRTAPLKSRVVATPKLPDNKCTVNDGGDKKHGRWNSDGWCCIPSGATETCYNCDFHYACDDGWNIRGPGLGEVEVQPAWP